MRSPTHRLISLEARLSEIALGLAAGNLPRHEAAALVYEAEKEVAALRCSLVEFTTRAARNAVRPTHSED